MSKKSMKQFNERKTAQKPMQDVQPKKVKKREVEAWILAIFMIAWTVCSVLGTIGFCRTQASAESVDAVDTVSVIDEKAVECSTAYNSKRLFSNADAITYSNYQGSWVLNLPCFTGLTFPNGSNSFASVLGNFSLVFTGDYIELSYVNGSSVYDLDVTSDEVPFTYYCSLGDGNFNSNSAMAFYSYSNQYANPFLSNYLPYRFTLSVTNFIYDGFDSYSFDLLIEWQDIEGNIIESTLNLDFNSYPAGNLRIVTCPYLGIRTMITGSLIGSPRIISVWTWDLYDFYRYTFSVPTGSYNAGYSQGVADGKQEGEKIGYSQGLEQGKQQGYNEGKADGYEEGVEDSNVYTFNNLIGAVFDAPIQAFQGLFSFEVLGVDLSGFLLSLLTCGIALCVIKLII